MQVDTTPGSGGEQVGSGGGPVGPRGHAGGSGRVYWCLGVDLSVSWDFTPRSLGDEILPVCPSVFGLFRRERSELGFSEIPRETPRPLPEVGDSMIPPTAPNIFAPSSEAGARYHDSGRHCKGRHCKLYANGHGHRGK